MDERAPRPRDAAATRKQLLDAAAALFAERGFDRTTVRDIADRAGVNQALLFRYFGSKDGLFAEALAQGSLEDVAGTPAEHLLETVLRRLLEPTPGDRSLQAFLRSTGNDSAAAATRRRLSEEYSRVLTTLTDADDAEDAALRADLVLAWLLGIGLVRQVTEKEPLASADPDHICALVLPAARTLLPGIAPQESTVDDTD